MSNLPTPEMPNLPGQVTQPELSIALSLLPPSIKDNLLPSAVVQVSQEQAVTINSNNTIGEMENLAAESSETRTVLFSIAVSFITTESQLIWSRYNTMLGANAFIAALLGIVFAKGTTPILDACIILCGSTIGLYLSWQ